MTPVTKSFDNAINLSIQASMEKDNPPFTSGVKESGTLQVSLTLKSGTPGKTLRIIDSVESESQTSINLMARFEIVDDGSTKTKTNVVEVQQHQNSNSNPQPFIVLADASESEKESSDDDKDFNSVDAVNGDEEEEVSATNKTPPVSNKTSHRTPERGATRKRKVAATPLSRQTPPISNKTSHRTPERGATRKRKVAATPSSHRSKHVINDEEDLWSVSTLSNGVVIHPIPDISGHSTSRSGGAYDGSRKKRRIGYFH